MRRATLPRRVPVAVGISAGALFAASPAIAGVDEVRATGRWTAYSQVVPAAASARIRIEYDAVGDTSVALDVRGLQPDTEYAAYAHVDKCGSTGSHAGPRVQHVVDPVSPSVDPAYANPVNEIWLDLTTDAAGNGTARTSVSWQLRPGRRGGSVVLHAPPPSSTSAGATGARLACLDVAF